MAVGKYDTHVLPKLLLIEAWARDGLTDEDICNNLDISVASFHNYKRDHVEFLESLKVSKPEADIRVENMLYKRAMGYSYEEVTYEAIEFKQGENSIPATKVKTVVKEVVPDTTAQIFWLKNRKPKEWRDKQEIDLRTPDGLEVLKDDELHDGITKAIQAIALLSERIGTPGKG